MQAADIFPRGAEQYGGLRLMQTQQVHDSVFDVRRSNRDHLIADVAMPAVFANG